MMSFREMNSRRVTTGFCLVVLFAVTLVIGALVTTAGATTLSAISGTVRSAAGGGRLAGVTVSVNRQGWAVDVTTDASGEYVINNVLPGSYTVTFTLTDRQTLVIKDVLVSPDNKTYLSPKLVYMNEGMEAVKTIVIVYEAPTLLRDRTNSTGIISSDELEMVPERTVEEAIGTEPGVVSVRRKYDGQNQPDLDIRGGRPYSNSFMLNGLEFTDPMTGLFTTTVSPHAIGQIDFVPSGFPVRYGDATAGLINILGKSGGEKYSGMIEAVTDNGIGSDYDRNWYSAYLSGPVPGLKGATFFGEAERRWLGDRDPSWLLDDKLPNNSLSGWSYHGRMDYRFVENALLTVSGDYSRNDWQEYIHYFNNPAFPDQIEHTPRFRDTNFGLSTRLTFEATPRTTYSLMGGYFQSERIMGDGVLFDDLAAYRREIANPLYDRFNLFREGDTVLASDVDPYVEPGSAADTMLYFAESYWQEFLHYETSYVTASGGVTQRFDQHELTFGASIRRYTVRKYLSLDATARYSSYRLDRYGYDSLGNEIEGDWRNSVKHPLYMSAYVQDRIELPGVLIVPGVRIDHYDYDALVLAYPSNPLGPDRDLYHEIKKDDLTSAKTYWRFSPRIGLAVPIGDIIQIHGSAGLRYQPPPFDYLYNGWDFFSDRILSGNYYVLGYGMSEPERAIEYELGVDLAVGPVFRAGVTGYYRKLSNQIAVVHMRARPYSYDLFVSDARALDRGIAARIESSPAQGVNMGLQYVISKAKGDLSYPADNTYNIVWLNPTLLSVYEQPLAYDQRHKFIGTMDVNFAKGEGPIIRGSHPFQNTHFSVLVRVGSGRPYTPMEVTDEVSPSLYMQIPSDAFYSRRMPWTFTIDLKLEKDIQLGVYTVTPFIWVKNLLDRKNVQWVYGGTGEPDTDGYLLTDEGQDRAANPYHGEEFVSRYLFAEANPQNYGGPREIYFGLRASF